MCIRDRSYTERFTMHYFLTCNYTTSSTFFLVKHRNRSIVVKESSKFECLRSFEFIFASPGYPLDLAFHERNIVTRIAWIVNFKQKNKLLNRREIIKTFRIAIGLVVIQFSYESCTQTVKKVTKFNNYSSPQEK